MLIMLTLIVASSGAFAQSETTCTEQKLVECYQILHNDQLSSAAILAFSTELIKEKCRRYKIFSECLKTMEPDCELYSFLLYKGVDDSYGFLCSDGYQDYLTYQPCFKEVDVQFEGKQCSDMFTSRTDYLKYNVTDKEFQKARLCQYSDDYVACVSNVVKSFCGLDAEQWQKTFDTKSLQPLMLKSSCRGWTTSPAASNSIDNNIWVIALGAAIVVTGIMVSIGLVCLLCSRCRCKRLHHRPCRRSLSIDMPPPPPYYPGPFTVCRMEPAEEAAAVVPSTSTASSSSSSVHHQHTNAEDEPKTATSNQPRVHSNQQTQQPRPQFFRSNSATKNGKSREETHCAGSNSSRTGSLFELADDSSSLGAVGGGPVLLCPPTVAGLPIGHFELGLPSCNPLSSTHGSLNSIHLCHLNLTEDDDVSLIDKDCDYY